MTRKNVLAVLCFVSLLSAACSSSKKNTIAKEIPSLGEAYKNDFLIGTALNNAHILERDSMANRLIKQQFSTATPENIMKAEVIHPGWERYNFEMADKLVEYGKKNNIKINAHTLIWHSQTAR